MTTARGFLVFLCLAAMLSGCNCGGGTMMTDDGGPIGGGNDASVQVDAGLDAGATTDAGFDAGAMVDAGFDAGAPAQDLEAAVVDDQGDLWALSLDGGARLLVSWQDAGLFSHVRSPRWQPDGTGLVFADGQVPWLLEADGGLTRFNLIVTGTSDYQGETIRVEWSPDGTRLAISGIDLDNDNDALFLLPADGGLVPGLVRNSQRWAWAGLTTLLLSDYVPARATFVTWRYDVLSGSTTEVTAAEFLDASRDGVSVLQRSSTGTDGGTEFAIETRTAAGLLTELLPRNAVAISATQDGVTLNPQGTELALRGTVVINLQALGFKALRVSTAGTVSTLYDRPGIDPDFPGCLRWLPDGERLSVLTADAPPRLSLVSPDGGVTTLRTPALRRPSELGCLDWHVKRD